MLTHQTRGVGVRIFARQDLVTSSCVAETNAAAKVLL